ncbi:MAG: hypothetical protein ABFD57_07065 [Smithella sp.]
MEPFLIILPVVMFAMSFIPIWLFVCLILSRVGGWKKLAQVYRYDGQFSGNRWRFRSCRMNRFVNYNNCLTFGAGAEGLYINIFPVFRFHHPPLLIPWSDIKEEKTKGIIFEYRELSFAGVSNVQLRIIASLAEQILNGQNRPEGNVVYRAYKKIEPH